MCLCDWAGKKTNRLRYREKMIKLDAEAKQYEMMVIGEEAHVAYNRVGLTDFFETRKIEDLYLNPAEWVCLFFTSPSSH
jgi:NAD(P)H-nitrite reductase large subunit